MKTNIISLLIVLLFASNAQAQQLANYLPGSPAAVVHIKPSVIQSKVNIEELNNLPLMENMWGALKGMTGKAQEEPFSFADIGIDANKEMYFYANRVDDGMAMVMAMHSTDESKLRKTIVDAGFEKDGNLDMGNLSVHASGSNFIAYGEGIVLSGMLNKTPAPVNPYDNYNWEEEMVQEEIEPSEEEFVEDAEDVELDVEEDIEVNIDIAEKAAQQEWFNTSMQSIVQSGVGLNPVRRAKLMKGKGVVTAWVDYEIMMDGITKMAGPMDPMTAGLYSSMYNGMEAFMDMQFNDGEFLMDANYSFPAQLTRGKDLTNNKVNKKFKKYIKGDNLLGVYSMALNTEAYGNMFKEFFLQATDAMPEAMGLGRDLAPLLGVIIDEEAIYNFFKGDMILAVTGVNSFEKTSTTYEYDEDFNPIEKTTTSEEKIPEFTAMVSVGDMVNMKRLLNVGKKMGVMEQAGNYYKVMNPMGFDVYMALKDGMFFISNDTQLMTQNLTAGVTNKIDSKQWKKIKKNSMFLFWDVPSSLNMASEFGLPVGDDAVNMSRESIKEITWSSPRKQGSNMNSAMRMTFVNDKENALKLILNFVNDMFFPSQDRTSM